MKTADWYVIFLTLAFVYATAIFAAWKFRRPGDFFTAGRRLRKIWLVLSTFGAGTSSDSQSSVMSMTWRSGLAGLWWQFIWLPIAPFFWILAPILRRLRSTTPADFFVLRFGHRTASLYAVYGIAMTVVLSAGVLFAGARMVNLLTHPLFDNLSGTLSLQIPVINLNSAFEPASAFRPPLVNWRMIGGDDLTAALLGVLIASIVAIGGMVGTILIDAVQGLTRVILTFVLMLLVFQQIGGFGELHKMESLKPGMLDFVANTDVSIEGVSEPFTPFYLAMLSAAALAGIVAQPHILMLCSMGRTELDSRIGFTFGSLLKRILAVAWSFMGLACLVWYLGPNSPLNSADASPEDRAMLVQLRAVAAPAASASHDDQVGNPPDPVALSIAEKTDHRFADLLMGRMARDLLKNRFPGLLGVFAAVIIAAVISHCGMQMVIGSGLFAEYLYREHLGRGRVEEHYRSVGRLAALLLIIPAVLLQMTFANMGDVLKLAIKTPAVIGVSMWMGLIWIRWNSIAVWTTTLAGIFLGILCGYFPEEVQKSLPALSDSVFLNGASGLVMVDAWKIVCILGGSLFCGIIAAFLTEPEPDDQLERFYAAIRTPVTPQELSSEFPVIPAEDVRLAPAISFLGFQLPGPTRGGIVGFVIAWIVVIGMIYLTKWLSLQI